MRNVELRRLLAVWVAVALAATIVISIGMPIVGKGAFHASDVLQVWSPWRHESPHAYQPQNGVVTDTVDAVLPTRAEFRSRVHDGDFPLWSPYLADGSPLGAIPNASTLSPFSLPYLVVPLWFAPALVKLLEMIVASGFAYLFARRIGLARAAAVVAGLVYVNTGFQVAWTNWPQAQVGALIPALFWAVERGLGGRPRDAWPAALVSAAMWLTGFPAVTFWAHGAVAVYALVRIAAHRDAEPLVASVRRVGALAGTLVLGVGIAAIQLVPFGYFVRGADLAYRAEKDVGSLPWEAAVTLAVPDAYGQPGSAVWYGPAHYVEIQSFVGITALLLVVVAAVAGRRVVVRAGARGFLWAAAVLVGLLIFWGGPLLAAHQAIPIVGDNQIGRMRGLLGFLVAMLAAVGVQALMDGDALRRRAGRLAVGTVALVGAVVLLLLPAWDAAVEAGRADFLRPLLVVAGAIALLAVVAVALAVATRDREIRIVAIGVVVLLVTLEAIAVARPFWARIPTELFYPETAAHAFVDDHLGHDRLAAAGPAMFPGSAPVYEYRTVTAHTLTPRPYADLLLAVDATVFDRSRTFPILRADADVATSPVLDRIGTRFFVVAPAEPTLGEVTVVSEQTSVEEVAAGRTLTSEIPAGPVRAVRLHVPGPASITSRTFIDVEIRDAGGQTLATGRRRLHDRDALGDIDVAVTPERAWPDGDDSPWTLDVTVAVDAAAGTIPLAMADEAAPAVRLVRPTDDRLEIVFTEGVTVYRRLDALPRIRWASRAEVIGEDTARVEALAGGLDPDVVVLSEAGPPAEGGEGGEADLEILEDSGDTITIQVDAATPGWVVVADSIQQDWRAQVNGEDAEIHPADHAFGAVHVEAGRHEISLTYSPSGWTAGRITSLLALIALVGFARSRRARNDWIAPYPPSRLGAGDREL